jgi:integrase
MAKRKIDEPWSVEGKLTDALVAALTPPPAGNKVKWHGEHGLGVRVTAAGARAYVFRYRNADGRDRTYTIGDPKDWPLGKAIDAAKALRRKVDDGKDPLAARQDQRSAPTVNDLADRFEAEHVGKKRPTTARDYKAILRLYIRPAIGNMKVSAVAYRDIERLHHRVAEQAPYMANRVLAVCSKMFNLAILWGMRVDSPCKGVEKQDEQRRQRYLSPAEIARLCEVLNDHPEKSSANAVKLLLLTGSRRAEALSAKWDQFNLDGAIWEKPHSGTKQRRDHRLPLSAPALQLLTEMKAEADQETERRQRYGLQPVPFLFPGKEGKPQTDLKHFWAAVCRKAGLTGVRVHDLRHTHASILASQGFSLQLIGALLGHTQAATTYRYAHLMDDPLRAAAERAGEIISGAGKEAAVVVPLARGRRT